MVGFVVLIGLIVGIGFFTSLIKEQTHLPTGCAIPLAIILGVVIFFMFIIIKM